MEMDNLRFWSLLAVLLVAAYLLSPPRFAAVANPQTGAVWILDRVTGKAHSCFNRCSE